MSRYLLGSCILALGLSACAGGATAQNDGSPHHAAVHEHKIVKIHKMVKSDASKGEETVVKLKIVNDDGETLVLEDAMNHPEFKKAMAHAEKGGPHKIHVKKKGEASEGGGEARIIVKHKDGMAHNWVSKNSNEEVNIDVKVENGEIIITDSEGFQKRIKIDGDMSDMDLESQGMIFVTDGGEGHEHKVKIIKKGDAVADGEGKKMKIIIHKEVEVTSDGEKVEEEESSLK